MTEISYLGPFIPELLSCKRQTFEQESILCVELSLFVKLISTVTISSSVIRLTFKNSRWCTHSMLCVTPGRFSYRIANTNSVSVCCEKTCCELSRAVRKFKLAASGTLKWETDLCDTSSFSQPPWDEEAKRGTTEITWRTKDETQLPVDESDKKHTEKSNMHLALQRCSPVILKNYLPESAPQMCLCERRLTGLQWDGEGGFNWISAISILVGHFTMFWRLMLKKKKTL